MADRILIVDDEESILLSFKKNFEHAGYEVVTAYSGENALYICKTIYFILW